MIENKSLGSKIFDVLNVVFLVIVMLICIMPVWYGQDKGKRSVIRIHRALLL